MIGYLILGFVYAFAAAVQPGPLQTYLISQTLEHGWRRTLPAACAPLISDGPIIVLILLVLSRIPDSSLHVLQTAGGIFLLYLAAGAFRTWRKYDVKAGVPPPSRQQTLLKAVLVNVLNPNPYLGWSLVMGPLLLKGWRESPLNGIALLAGFYSTIIAGNIAIVLLFVLARNLGPRVSRALIGVSVVALACFGGYELWRSRAP